MIRWKPGIIPIVFLLLVSILSPVPDQKQYIKDIRHNRFFLVEGTGGKAVPKTGFLFRGDEKIGGYSTIKVENSVLLCQLDTCHPKLDNTCYIPIRQKAKHPVKTPGKKADISSFRVDQFLFVKKGHSFITRDPIPLKHIGNVENLPRFLESIEKKSTSRYKARIPRAREIIQSPAHFSDSKSGKFIICNFQNRLGYAYQEDGEIVTKPVLKETVNKLKNKFYFYIILR